MRYQLGGIDMKRILLTLTLAGLLAACTGCWSSAPEPTAAPTTAPTAAPTATVAPTVAATSTMMPANTDALPTEAATGTGTPEQTAQATSNANA